jgi:PPK2 family polyphosphate:nucleotide phosphotransferase
MAKALNHKDLARLFRVEPGKSIRLKQHDPGWMGTTEMRELGVDRLKDRAKELLRTNVERLAEAHELLWASDRHSLLVVLQAMDTAGKDGTIKHVMSGLNPQGCSVHSFKKPSDEELDHNFLWRYMKAAPERGKIVVFNRSHYEDVIVTKVHPELLDLAKLPPGKRGKSFWQARCEDINAFERHLARNGTVILKFFLHLSRKEQKRRLLDRLENPEKHWKFSLADLEERRFWSAYMDAYEKAMEATSKGWAPWWIIPADHKFVARVLVALIIADAVESLDLKYPEVSSEKQRALMKARRQLLAE